MRSRAIKKSLKMGSLAAKNKNKILELFSLQNEIAEIQKNLAILKQKEKALFRTEVLIPDDVSEKSSGQ